jgi:hypothetical protein
VKTIPVGMKLPRNLGEIDAEYLTGILRSQGLIKDSNSIVSVVESGVGMTAGYFSDIKKMKVTFAESTECCDAFVAKAWPDFEMLPSEAISDMFVKDIKGYMMKEDAFFPRPRVFLADYDSSENRWGLIMEDVSGFAQQKVHEQELNLDEVLDLIPGLVDAAIAWEGCHEGSRLVDLQAAGIEHWCSDANLAVYREVMPGGAKLFDKVVSMPESSLVNGRAWDQILGVNVAELFTHKLEAFFDAIKPENGGTCTLSHGDLRGDNLFLCEKSPAYPEGWITIDFQLLFQGPVPSDLAYLMSSGTVLPEVYQAENRRIVQRRFYDLFMSKTQRYVDYSFAQFEREYAIMSTVLFVYYVGMGGAIWRSAAFENEGGGRIELGSEGVTEMDLEAEDLRKRMWWAKAIANFLENFLSDDFADKLTVLPDNVGAMGQWVELPAHLRTR